MFLRCARKDVAEHRSAEGGAALISALLTVALVATLSGALISQIGFASDLVGGRRDLAQARWLTRGAVDWARNILADDQRLSAVDHLGEPWARKVPPLPVENGEIGGDLEDLDRRFNLNALVRDGKTDPQAVAAYLTLLANLGFPEAQAMQLTDVLLDWLDPDDIDRRDGTSEAAWYAQTPSAPRPANAPLTATTELHRISGYSPSVTVRLGTFVSALPSDSAINLNTAPPEILSAVLPGVDLATARGLVSRRNQSWFRNLADLDAVAGGAYSQSARVPVSIQSRYFLVRGQVRFGEAMVVSETLLFRDGNWPSILATLWL